MVAYGDNNNWFAAWFVWNLKYYGHKDARLMNGGRKKWQDEGRELVTDAPTIKPASYTAGQPNKAIRALRDEVLRDLGKSGVVLVDVTVPIRFDEGRPDYFEPPEGSNAERIAARLPRGALLVGAFKTIPAHVMADLRVPLDCDDFVCGDSIEAKEKVMAAASLIPGLRPLDAGPLRAARTLERMTVLAIALNRRYKRKGARYRVQGL